MKRTIYRLLAILITASVFFAACTKEDPDVRLDPKLSTIQMSNITSDGATFDGFVVASGSGFTERGICYNTATAPTVANKKAIYTGTSKSATFTVSLTGLTYATKYFARAYATNAEGVTIYGEEFNFTTAPIVPELNTAAITEITGNTATGGGIVMVTGGAAVTKQGICWSTNRTPTVADNKTENGNASGPYVSALTNLKGSTYYYVRAYAINSAGTGYGPEVSFQTLVDKPTVTTAAITALTKVSATTGGEVTYDGGGTISARGIVWGLSADPGLNDNKIVSGTGVGVFVSNITGLTKNTTYHVRAFATNTAGTAFGADVPFTTLADILTWYVPGDYLATSYPGYTYANWAPASSPIVKNSPASPDKLEGYVYMAGASNNWKFTSDPDWNHTNYGLTTGTPGLLNTSSSAGNLNLPAGYYKLVADFPTLTYTAVATVWGVIGDASPNGWTDETALTYNPASRTWQGGMHLKAGSFKFRANHSWDYNYGSTAANSTLDAGGSNIAIAVEGDYYFTLDLSHPQAYTYSTITWGLIGDATPGGWGADTPMAWDATNKVWTVTVALVSSGGAKSFKFRANQGWDINLGGKGTSDGTADNYTDATTAPLAAGGKNLGVPGNVSGTYKVTLDPVTLIAKVVLQ